MDSEDVLFSVLKYLLWINAIIVLIRFWPRHQSTKKSFTEKEIVWSWKDTIHLIILILSTISICVLPFVIFSFLNKALGTWMLVIICVSSGLRYAVNVIPSTKTIGLIINDNTKSKLNVKENVAIILLASIILILNQLQVQDIIKSYAISCNNPIWGDMIIAIISFLTILRVSCFSVL